jgi:DNA-binding transcriptional LysR family regulator
VELDLNLLRVFDALVAEGSVTGAAARLHLSVPATSRALARLRRAVGDPVLVRAGRGLVPTPLATRSAPQVRAVLEAAGALFVDERDLRLDALDRTFTVRANEAVAADLGPRLLHLVLDAAPRVGVRLVGEGTEEIDALRDGSVDLDIGVRLPAAPDLREVELYEDRIVAVVAVDSALGAAPSLAEICAHPHVSASRRGRARGPLDDALAARGLSRRVAVVVGTFATAAMMAAATDLVALVPGRFAERHGPGLGVRAVPVPLDLPPVVIVAQWHARLDADPAHVWFRGVVRRAAVG